MIEKRAHGFGIAIMFHVLRNHGVLLPRVEQRLSGVGFEDQAPKGVHICGNCLRRVPRLPDLRRAVVGGATARTKVAASETEIDEHRLWRLTDSRDGVGVAHDDVRRLEIEMPDAHLVHGVEPRAHSEQQISRATQ